MSGTIVEPVHSVKFLGDGLDKRMSFRVHQRKTLEKAKVLPLPGRILPNLGGSKYGKRKILYGVVKSITVSGFKMGGCSGISEISQSVSGYGEEDASDGHGGVQNSVE